MKKELTAEQRAATEARRARFKELCKKIANMTVEQRQEFASKLPAIVTAEGRPLSTYNSCLAIMQHDGVTIVGGLRQWRKQGRAVKKGAHGIAIWIPKKEKAAADAGVVGEEDGEAGTSFFAGYVFDISDTQEAAA